MITARRDRRVQQALRQPLGQLEASIDLPQQLHLAITSDAAAAEFRLDKMPLMAEQSEDRRKYTRHGGAMLI